MTNHVFSFSVLHLSQSFANNHILRPNFFGNRDVAKERFFCSYLVLRGSGGTLPCSFFTSISLLRRKTSLSFPKEPLRWRAPLPSCRYTHNQHICSTLMWAQQLRTLNLFFFFFVVISALADAGFVFTTSCCMIAWQHDQPQNIVTWNMYLVSLKYLQGCFFF